MAILFKTKMWDDIGIPQNRFCRHRWKKQKHLLIHISIYIYIIYLYVYLYIHTSIHLYIYAHAQVALPTAPPWQSISAFPAQVPGKRCHLLPAACVAGEPRGYLEANHKIKGCGYLIYIYIYIWYNHIYIYMAYIYIYIYIWIDLCIFIVLCGQLVRAQHPIPVKGSNVQLGRKLFGRNISKMGWPGQGQQFPHFHQQLLQQEVFLIDYGMKKQTRFTI